MYQTGRRDKSTREFFFLGSAQWGQWSLCNRSGCLPALNGGRRKEAELTGWLLLVTIPLLVMPELAVAIQKGVCPLPGTLIYANTFPFT